MVVLMVGPELLPLLAGCTPVYLDYAGYAGGITVPGGMKKPVVAVMEAQMAVAAGQPREATIQHRLSRF